MGSRWSSDTWNNSTLPSKAYGAVPPAVVLGIPANEDTGQVDGDQWKGASSATMRCKEASQDSLHPRIQSIESPRRSGGRDDESRGMPRDCLAAALVRHSMGIGGDTEVCKVPVRQLVRLSLMTTVSPRPPFHLFIGDCPGGGDAKQA